jgi:hypothetical protein
VSIRGWIAQKREGAGRIYSPGADSSGGDLSEVLLRGEPELDTAVFENDHERVGVTRVQIATVHVAVNRWLFSSVKMLLGNKFRYQLEAILEIVTARRSQRLSRL